MLRFFTVLLAIGGCISPLLAQVNYTANDQVTPYTAPFRPAVNLGAYPGFSDAQLAELAAGKPSESLNGVGAKALRPGLFEDFLYNFGYDSRVSTFDYYAELGLTDHTLIVGFPADVHREPNYYCADHQSTLFANLYEPIWDDNNGTPINENNFYADYLYRTVQLYGEHIKFWEIWNEPGFDYTSNRGWLLPGDPGNWWDNNPDPCEYKLRAPIYHYVRMLRISYEVIKTLSPDDYVVVSGVGYPSFLDAILRNTDNPIDGTVGADYPHGGGAYFDVMGYHSYPHFDGSLRRWNEAAQDWDYFRHSDAAAEGMVAMRDTFQNVLDAYGYDGITYPEKEWTITEVNLPRKEYGEFIGSAEAQRNFMIKAYVAAARRNFVQLDVYKLAEETTFDQSYDEFNLMGLYQKLTFADGGFQAVNDEGKALATATELLFGKTYDAARTAALQLPAGTDGGAFVDANGYYTYVLWAKTTLDRSESAQASYTWPAALSDPLLRRFDWGYAYDRTSSLLDPNVSLALTGSPVFVEEQPINVAEIDGCAPFDLTAGVSPVAGESYQWVLTDDGGEIVVNATAASVAEILTAPGHYTLTLHTTTPDGTVSYERCITVREAPTANFESTTNGPVVSFANLASTNTTDFDWTFGDGSGSTDANPLHLYLESGSYQVELHVANGCGTDTYSQTITVEAPTTTLLDATANDAVMPYTGRFKPGTNMRFYPFWTDEELADIARGKPGEAAAPGGGVRALRGLLGQFFVEGWTYDIRQSTYEYYENLDLRDNVLTLGFPSVNVVDSTYYCATKPSTLFRDMYRDIWDDGSDGTPINEANPYATYVYNVALVYGPQVTFWEVFNSPDFEPAGERGWLEPGQPGNWWDQNPDPCDLELGAPIFNYIRALRITYEVIKTVDPDSYVTLSGISYPSFLDAVLRNTDNPVDGSPVTGYEHGGGAYFDAVGYKSYPHFDGSTFAYSQAVGDFVYERHSDAAATGIAREKAELQSVLANYGYDGSTYPEKEWLIVEANVPRLSYDNFLGNETAQRNWLPKAWVAAVKHDVRQLHLNSIAERQVLADATDAFDVMGIFENLNTVSPYNQTPTPVGVSLATTTDLLYPGSYDEARTAQLGLPDGVDGAAFGYATGEWVYVLWAKTTEDNSEAASATYAFPPTLETGLLNAYAWDYSQTNQVTTVDAGAVALTGAPLFLTSAASLADVPRANFSQSATSACAGEPVTFVNTSTDATDYLWEFPGGTPATSTAANPSVTYAAAGTYAVRLTASSALGSHQMQHAQYLTVGEQPVADFTYLVDGTAVTFTNLGTNADESYWIFDTGLAPNYAFNPTYFYGLGGSYEVSLVVSNDCGSDTLTQTVLITNLPISDYQTDVTNNCTDFTVVFNNVSGNNPTNYQWTFEGGDPMTSTAFSPAVSYAAPGTYNVTMISENAFGFDTLEQTITLTGATTEALSAELCAGGTLVVNGTVYDAANPTGTELLPQTNQYGCDSTVHVSLSFIDSYTTNLIDTIAFGEEYVVGNSVYTETGQYVDSLVASTGCDSLVFLDLIVLTTNVAALPAGVSELYLTPNPTTGKARVNLYLQQAKTIHYALLDIHGRVLTQFPQATYPAGRQVLPIGVGSYAAGIYLVRVRIGDATVVRRLVVE